MTTDNTVFDPGGLVAPLLALCRSAGEAICRHYHAPGADQFESKRDDTPLTRADIDAHNILEQGLASMSPGLPVLSEESTREQLAERRSWTRFWLVDPLDGTKEFLARTGEFTINIALVEAHCPVLGILYLPLAQQAYVGIPGQGAWCYDYAGEWQRKPVSTRGLRTGEPVTVLASRRHHGPRLGACLDWLETAWGPLQRRDSGSALKFCQLAAGQGDFYPRFSPCSEWDTAAGQALLEAAGGALLGMDGRALRYNCRGSLLSPHFYALGDPAHPLWQRLLQAAPHS
jgi:3'(2'), 5'-bisphosphate nucleotidase